MFYASPFSIAPTHAFCPHRWDYSSLLIAQVVLLCCKFSIIFFSFVFLDSLLLSGLFIFHDPFLRWIPALAYRMVWAETSSATSDQWGLHLSGCHEQLCECWHSRKWRESFVPSSALTAHNLKLLGAPWVSYASKWDGHTYVSLWF